jgi:hypothetical protein
LQLRELRAQLVDRQVLVDAVESMRRRDHRIGAVVGRHAAHRDRIVERRGPVVDAWQDMRVKIDHWRSKF